MNFRLVFKNNSGKNYSLEYRLLEDYVPHLWIKKIKHLKSIPVSKIHTNYFVKYNLEKAHKDFCDCLKIPFEKLDYKNQKTLNYLHELYEKYHNSLSNKDHDDILYNFHESIHYFENEFEKAEWYNVGWGIKEGPLTNTLPNASSYYADAIVKNNIYLPWAELGKKPYTYFLNNEPCDEKRFCDATSPHITFRAKFTIAMEDFNPIPFPMEFSDFFHKLKSSWKRKYGVDSWTEVDQYCGIPLAEPFDRSVDVKQVVSEYKIFSHIEI